MMCLEGVVVYCLIGSRYYSEVFFLDDFDFGSSVMIDLCCLGNFIESGNF